MTSNGLVHACEILYFQLDHTSRKVPQPPQIPPAAGDQMCKHMNRMGGPLHPNHSKGKWGSDWPWGISWRQALGIQHTKEQGYIVQWVSVIRRVNLHSQSLPSSTYSSRTYTQLSWQEILRFSMAASQDFQLIQLYLEYKRKSCSFPGEINGRWEGDQGLEAKKSI